jgi:hypothetical protein
MKTLRSLSILLTLFFVLGLVVQCSDDPAPVDLSTISGTVTYPDGSGAPVAAPGAVITLFSTTPVVNMQTVSDADGKFSFSNLVAATYTLAAYYDTENQNNAGRFSGLRFAIAPTDVTITNQDVAQDLALTSEGQPNITLAMDINYAWEDGASNYVRSGSWRFEDTRAPVQFEFRYRDATADFLGSFSQLNKLVLNFDPANLASSNITAIVDLTSFNTRSPGGRDPISSNNQFRPTTVFNAPGCMMDDLGIPLTGVTFPTTIGATGRYSTFTSTSIAAYGDGYLAKGNMVWLGVTLPIELMFKAIPQTVDPDNGRTYYGFEGGFLMHPKDDFNFVSTSLNDADITVRISIIAYKTL